MELAKANSPKIQRRHSMGSIQLRKAHKIVKKKVVGKRRGSINMGHLPLDEVHLM